MAESVKPKLKPGTKAAGVTNKKKLKAALKKFEGKNVDPEGPEAARLKASKQRLGLKGELTPAEKSKKNKKRKARGRGNPLT